MQTTNLTQGNLSLFYIGGRTQNTFTVDVDTTS